MSTSDEEQQPLTLTAAVRRRRADQVFLLRVLDSIAEHHRALERIGT
jgi:hypothetical protein